MKIILLNTGKTEEKHIAEALDIYSKRLKHYCSFEIIAVNPGTGSGKLAPAQLKQYETELLVKKLKPDDFVVLLDEKGRQFRSVEFAGWINEHQIRRIKRMVFITGGAYGFHETMYKRANEKISLSNMTFPHQLVRLIFIEQLYRAFTIIRNEPYHHE
ncbi:MAG: 23S rRNA (pseudouridine(1915)-N(3))-methyltransferase RlmH [Bacteroidales bacterium]